MGNRDNQTGTGGRIRHGAAAMSTQANQAIKDFGPQGGEQIRPSQAEIEVKEAHHLIEKNRQHSELQSKSLNQLKTILPNYNVSQAQLSELCFNWFKHQGFWPADWEPQRVAWLATEGQQDFGSFDGDQGDQLSTITITMVEYIRLKKMEKLGLIVTEVAETMEAVRNNDAMNELEELGDIDVRLQDYKGGFGMAYSAAPAYGVKMEKNLQRPFRHGKKF